MFKLNKAEREYIDTHRGQYCPEPRWYAAMTHWGRESQVRERIERELGPRGIGELLLPELTAPEKNGASDTTLIFNGYLFFRCAMNDEIYLGIYADPWIYRIFGRAYRIPEPIADEEMNLFRSLLSATPRPRLVNASHIGARAVVIEGLLEGLQGRVVEISTRFVKLETQFTFLDQGSCIVVSVAHDWVRLEPAAANPESNRSTIL